MILIGLVILSIYLISFRYSVDDFYNNITTLVVYIALCCAFITVVFSVFYILMLRFTDYCMDFDVFSLNLTLLCFMCLLVFDIVLNIMKNYV